MKILLFPVLLLLLFSCNSAKEEASTDENVVAEVDTVAVVKTESPLYIWSATPDYEKIKNPAAPGSLPLDSLIKGLNVKYENVLLEKLKQSGDTLYTRIADSRYLGNQMGTTGAEIYLADVILNLTTVPGVNYVSIDMEEQSHTQAGVWNKEAFKNYKEKKP